VYNSHDRSYNHGTFIIQYFPLYVIFVHKVSSVQYSQYIDKTIYHVPHGYIEFLIRFYSYPSPELLKMIFRCFKVAENGAKAFCQFLILILFEILLERL